MILQSIEYTCEHSGRYRVSCEFLCTDYVGDVQSLMGKDVRVVDSSNMSAPVEKVVAVKKPKKIKKEIIPPNPIRSCFDRMDLSDG